MISAVRTPPGSTEDSSTIAEGYAEPVEGPDPDLQRALLPGRARSARLEHATSCGPLTGRLIRPVGDLPVVPENSTDEVAVHDALTRVGQLADVWVGDALRGNATPDDGFTQRLLERMRREGIRRDDSYDPLGGA